MTPLTYFDSNSLNAFSDFNLYHFWFLFFGNKTDIPISLQGSCFYLGNIFRIHFQPHGFLQILFGNIIFFSWPPSRSLHYEQVYRPPPFTSWPTPLCRKAR